MSEFRVVTSALPISFLWSLSEDNAFPVQRSGCAPALFLRFLLDTLLPASRTLSALTFRESNVPVVAQPSLRPLIFVLRVFQRAGEGCVLLSGRALDAFFRRGVPRGTTSRPCPRSISFFFFLLIRRRRDDCPYSIETLRRGRLSLPLGCRSLDQVI